MTPLLEVDACSISYGAIDALRNVSLEVHRGEAVAILGANGAGKTTLLNAVAGLLKPAGGYIRFDDRDVSGLRPAQLVRKGIVQVPEGRQIFSRMTVMDNLRIGGYVWRRSGLDQGDVGLVFSLFPRLAERRHQVAGTLSGGEQQMLAIGRALMAKPKLLMLDEPTMGLSPRLTANVLEALRRINEDVTMLIVEQNVRAALSLASRGYLLEAGQIRFSGPAATLTDDKIRATYLGG